MKVGSTESSRFCMIIERVDAKGDPVMVGRHSHRRHNHVVWNSW